MLDRADLLGHPDRLGHHTCRSPKTTLNSIFLTFLQKLSAPVENLTEPFKGFQTYRRLSAGRGPPAPRCASQLPLPAAQDR
jgi:hypothetical protein